MKKHVKLVFSAWIFCALSAPAYSSSYEFHATVHSASPPVLNANEVTAKAGDQLLGKFSYEASNFVLLDYQSPPSSGQRAGYYGTTLHLSFKDLTTGFSYDSDLAHAFAPSFSIGVVENDVVPIVGPKHIDTNGNAIGADKFTLTFDKEAHAFSESGALNFIDLDGKALDIRGFGGVILPNTSIPSGLTLSDFTSASFNYLLSDYFNNRFYSFNATIDTLVPAAPIPEPQPYLMMLVGLLMLAGVRQAKVSRRGALKTVVIPANQPVKKLPRS